MEYSGEGNVPEQNQDFCREEEMEMEQQNPVIWVANEFENICVFAMEQSRKEKKKTPQFCLIRGIHQKLNSVVSLSFVYFLILFPEQHPCYPTWLLLTHGKA